MKTALDDWIEFTRASIDEQLAEIAAKDEEAFALFMQKLLVAMD